MKYEIFFKSGHFQTIELNKTLEELAEYMCDSERQITLNKKTGEIIDWRRVEFVREQ